MAMISAPAHVGAVAVPRVNLLPPEIEQQRRARKIYAALIAAPVAAVGAVHAFYISALGQVSKS